MSDNLAIQDNTADETSSERLALQPEEKDKTVERPQISEDGHATCSATGEEDNISMAQDCPEHSSSTGPELLSLVCSRPTPAIRLDSTEELTGTGPLTTPPVQVVAPLPAPAPRQDEHQEEEALIPLLLLVPSMEELVIVIYIYSDKPKYIFTITQMYTTF
jgi:hypothetical protein